MFPLDFVPLIAQRNVQPGEGLFYLVVWIVVILIALVVIAVIVAAIVLFVMGIFGGLGGILLLANRPPKPKLAEKKKPPPAPNPATPNPARVNAAASRAKPEPAEPRQIRSECQHCLGAYDIDSRAIGSSVNCPRCGQQTVVTDEDAKEARRTVVTWAIALPLLLFFGAFVVFPIIITVYVLGRS